MKQKATKGLEERYRNYLGKIKNLEHNQTIRIARNGYASARKLVLELGIMTAHEIDDIEYDISQEFEV